MLLKQILKAVSFLLRRADDTPVDAGPQANNLAARRNGHSNSNRISMDSLSEGVSQQELLLFGTSLRDLESRLHYGRFTAQVFQKIESRYDHRLPLDATARACGVSPNHLNNRLKEYSGFPFHQLLIRYRLFKACEMMKRQDSNLLEIALDSGFGSVSSFERQFKRILGVTPSDYRKSLRLD